MRERTIKAIQYGVGAAGSRMVRLAMKKGVQFVGAVDADPAKVGKDVGVVAAVGPVGVRIVDDPARLFTGKIADVVLHATSHEPRQIVSEVVLPLRAGVNVISISGMSFLQRQFPDLAREIDGAARAGGATALGTGLNPGFAQDVLPIVLSGACEDVTQIVATRVTDVSPWGPEVVRPYGIGLSEKGFRDGVAAGSIELHSEIRQSVDMIAYALGWELDEIREDKSPLLTAVERRAPHVTVRSGMVCGFRHRASGIRAGEDVIELQLVGIISPDRSLDGVEPGTTVVVKGSPTVRAVIEGGIGLAQEVYAATAARAVNAIPHVLRATPGLAALPDLPVMAWWKGVD